MRSILGMLLAGVGVLAFAGPANAAVRYAEPGGDGPATSCPRQDPCEIHNAVEDASPGDEVILRPGTYVVGSGGVSVPTDIDLHGALGQPRPLITSTDFSALNLFGSTGSHVHDLRLENTNGNWALFGFGSAALIERVVAVSDGPACNIPATPGLIRDSVCSSTGPGGRAIDVQLAGTGTLAYRLRNVTAIATATSGDGLNFTTDNLALTVNARNVIAQGGTGMGAFDVSANVTGTGSVDIDLANSSYGSRAIGGNSTITDPATNDNQSEPPQLVDPAAGNFHQRRGSPTVDAGAVVPLLGRLDFERQARVDGSAPDIGADEVDAGLRLKVKAKKKQKAKKLKIKVSCPHCDVLARGTVRAGGENFKLKRKERFVKAGEKQKMRLKIKKLGHLKDVLEQTDGKAKIKVKGADSAGVTAMKRKTIKLTG